MFSTHRAETKNKKAGAPVRNQSLCLRGLGGLLMRSWLTEFFALHPPSLAETDEGPSGHDGWPLWWWGHSQVPQRQETRQASLLPWKFNQEIHQSYSAKTATLTRMVKEHYRSVSDPEDRKKKICLMMDDRITLTPKPLQPIWTNSGLPPQFNGDYSSC